MLLFLVKRFGVMMLTALVLTFVVFYLTNLYPNLEKLAKTQANNRMTDDQVATWLDNRGYNRPVLARYGEWLGVVPGWTRTDDEGKTTGRCISSKVPGISRRVFAVCSKGISAFPLCSKNRSQISSTGACL